ncbi:MAG TPA: hypothetical protein VJ203_08115 [Bacteroidales bacterium]|nr:hypothetical protein [Bacteroidales bacterium]
METTYWYGKELVSVLSQAPDPPQDPDPEPEPGPDDPPNRPGH